MAGKEVSWDGGEDTSYDDYFCTGLLQGGLVTVTSSVLVSWEELVMVTSQYWSPEGVGGVGNGNLFCAGLLGGYWLLLLVLYCIDVTVLNELQE